MCRRSGLVVGRAVTRSGQFHPVFATAVFAAALLLLLAFGNECSAVVATLTQAPADFSLRFVANGRIGNNSLVPGRTYGTREVSLTENECGWDSFAEIGQYVWTSGQPTPFTLTYSATQGLARFCVGYTSVVHVVETPLQGNAAFLFRLSASRTNTSIRLYNLTLNGQPVGIDLQATNGEEVESFLATTTSVSDFCLEGVATLCFPAGAGKPNNDQLSFLISVGTVESSGENPLPEDGDADGLPDAWEVEFFGDPANCDPADDPDGDGASNADEYAAETDPTDDQSVLSVMISSTVVTNSSPTRSEPSGCITVPRLAWPSASNRTYSVWRATTLSQGMAGFSPIAVDIPGTPPYNVINDPDATGAGPYYYRVRVHRPQ